MRPNGNVTLVSSEAIVFTASKVDQLDLAVHCSARMSSVLLIRNLSKSVTLTGYVRRPKAILT